MVINGVVVDFIGKYTYPYFLRKYKGYVIKVVSSISSKEVVESIKIKEVGYFPIYVLRCDISKHIRSISETEKYQFNLKYIKLEIEKSILDIKNFKGLVIVSLGNKEMVCCNNFYSKKDFLEVEGFSGNLKDLVNSSLTMYNRRIVV